MNNEINLENIDREIENITWNPKIYYTSQEDYNRGVEYCGFFNNAWISSSGSINYSLDYYDSQDDGEF